ncbi:vacuolar-sorting protein BRO1-like isoform X2 [Mangifera indica]|uniref:vacuolar-sorting protein BRO1-like isoform X2 n=1 Tax=Mangifera indica TaxID=29780 RepID=UPI001CFAD261|nr:vacuolar-sorting protein BRO1-like isoform X2 [Mangifera indica]
MKLQFNRFLEKLFLVSLLLEVLNYVLLILEDHINTITFLWYNAFKAKQKASQQNIHLEKLAVLFNLGAVYGQMGLSVNCATMEGLREASHTFIAAAGAFPYLRDNASTKASMRSPTTVDVSLKCTGMLERLMLAQAQECLFENTIAKGSMPGVCTKISRQSVVAWDMLLKVYSNFVDAQERRRIEQLELFDEFEWHMMQKHYCVAYAINDAMESPLS